MNKKNFTKSIIRQHDGYVTVTTITKDFIIVPRVVGYDYIPREKFSKAKKNEY